MTLAATTTCPKTGHPCNLACAPLGEQATPATCRLSVAGALGRAIPLREGTQGPAPKPSEPWERQQAPAAKAEEVSPFDAGNLLREAARIVTGDRQDTHGPRERSFRAIASVWEAYLRARRDPTAPISAADVAAMMTLLKLVRAVQGKPTPDHYIDAAGYAGLAGEMALRR